MSISSAMLAGVSSLLANSTAMSVVSDNIANSNTTAFKRNRSDFTRLVNVQSTSIPYSAGGVTTRTRQLITAQGSLNSTGTVTDLAISGQGFFVVSPNKPVGSAADDVAFTRVGSFTPDDDGNLVNQAGFYLQGWRVKSNGDLTTSPTDLTLLETVNINSVSGTATPSTIAKINGNLKSTTPTNPNITNNTYNVATNNMASGAVKPDVAWTFQIYDSLGGLKTFTLGMLKSATANQWTTEIYASPASNIAAGAPLVNGQIAVGTLAFTPNGRIDTTNTTAALLGAFNIGAATANPPAPGTVSWAPSTGLAAQSFRLDLGQISPEGGVTQFDSATSISSTTTDGALFSEVRGIEVSKDGFVTALFNNGVTRKLYKLPIGTFVNPEGLRPGSGGIYRPGDNSGNYNLKQAGEGGAGQVNSSSLEASTVDLALEFTNMISVQRAYSASSKIITTADEMLDEVIRMKR
ncbi:flagellar hook protein FlgE [Candidatus Phycosocius spiralis]|uniref:Flagellar hook protein FlgE n=1 Tax=Candidatus Phycosocius spiralis TaxID=2815099 RepID=A0ABQ4PTB1_9PROT|nr:flagellar hook protein FlgE [Candidatus Phycosocius spiralis]GIU66223.1 flagellar hook protein FlgE [Candidatus Phycosocius spiralis]